MLKYQSSWPLRLKARRRWRTVRTTRLVGLQTGTRTLGQTHQISTLEEFSSQIWRSFIYLDTIKVFVSSNSMGVYWGGRCSPSSQCRMWGSAVFQASPVSCNQSWIFNCIKNWGELSPLQPSPVISQPSLLMNYSAGWRPSSRPRMRLWLTGAGEILCSVSVCHPGSGQPLPLASSQSPVNTGPGGNTSHLSGLKKKKKSERKIILSVLEFSFVVLLKSFDTTWEYFVASSDLQKSSFYHEKNNIIL